MKKPTPEASRKHHGNDLWLLYYGAHQIEKQKTIKVLLPGHPPSNRKTPKGGFSDKLPFRRNSLGLHSSVLLTTLSWGFAASIVTTSIFITAGSLIGHIWIL